MFFIIGITPKLESLGRGSGVCLACGKAVDFHITKQYSVFTFFFIPIISFGASYLAECPNCDSLMTLSKEKGRDYEHGHRNTIYGGDMQIIKNNTGPSCSACGAKIIADQNFCYHCGTKL